MTSRLVSRPSQPPTRPANDIDNYDVDDDDPFADSGDEAAKNNGSAETQSKKRKEASGLGIDEAVSVSKKPRVPRVKLDETRLLSDNGIPKLRAKARSLHFKGKGHEVCMHPCDCTPSTIYHSFLGGVCYRRFARRVLYYTHSAIHSSRTLPACYHSTSSG